MDNVYQPILEQLEEMVAARRLTTRFNPTAIWEVSGLDGSDSLWHGDREYEVYSEFIVKGSGGSMYINHVVRFTIPEIRDQVVDIGLKSSMSRLGAALVDLVRDAYQRALSNIEQELTVTVDAPSTSEGEIKVEIMQDGTVKSLTPSYVVNGRDYKAVFADLLRIGNVEPAQPLS